MKFGSRRHQPPARKSARPKSGEVVTGQLPLVRCDVCGRTVAVKPGKTGQQAIQEHYEKEGHI